MNNRALHLLSFSLGFLLLFHGIDKLRYGVEFIDNMVIAYIVPYSKPHIPFFSCFNCGVDVMENILIANSIPYAKYVAYGVYLGEVVAPIFLIFHRYVKIASTIIVLNMSVAIFLVYRDALFSIGKDGAWSAEVPMIYLIMALTLVFLKEEKKTKK
jgi:putative oxidoreductase